MTPRVFILQVGLIILRLGVIFLRRIMTGGHFLRRIMTPRSLFDGGHYSSLHRHMTFSTGGVRVTGRHDLLWMFSNASTASHSSVFMPDLFVSSALVLFRIVNSWNYYLERIFILMKLMYLFSY